MLEARELLCERDERTLFSGLSFTLNAGEWVQITGSNGAGKTTLLRLLTGLSRPDAGEVLWQGQPLHQVRDSYHQNLLFHRLTMAQNEWRRMKDNNSQECRNCHNFEYMDTTAQKSVAAKMHDQAVKDGQTCIDCHKGIAHKLPDMREVEPGF